MAMNSTWRLGAGLVALGFGIYRYSRGRRDWLTNTALTSGISVAISSLTGGRRPRVRRRVSPGLPQSLADLSIAALNALR